MISVKRIVAFCLIAAASASGQNRPTDSLTGKPFRFAIDQPGTVFWSNSPLRESMIGLSKTKSVPVWLDRRCDPTQRVTFTSGALLRDSLWALAKQEDRIDVAWTPELIYIGPRDEADRWATTNLAHRDMLRTLPIGIRREWLREKPWQWSQLTNPQNLLAKLETELGQKIDGREAVLHDLWPAAKFPPLPLYIRLELLLAGYSKTFVVSKNGEVRVVDMPKSPRVKRKFTKRADKKRLSELLHQNHPGASLAADDIIVASWRVHESVRREFSERKTKAQNLAGILFTLQAKQQPVGPLVNQLAKQLSLNCKFSDAAAEKFDEMVSFEIERGSFETLMKKVLEPAQLTFTIEKQDLKIETVAERAAQP